MLKYAKNGLRGLGVFFIGLSIYMFDPFVACLGILVFAFGDVLE